ncbi:hypothetical protein HYDPIDRAFT_109197 [Hydnomerulius pinastri MD-312]|nr:hypothetical protein HYDPIDRAFT_109197 [Hydnomerulius pinastri MD-312]
MTSGNKDSKEPKNASGLTPSQSKALEERTPEAHENKILTAIKEMYSCRPKESTFSIYTKDAVFHDPVGIARGADAIKAQFIGLAKLFDKADIPKFRVLQNPPGLASSIILVDQDVAYYYKNAESSSSPTKTVNSLLTIQTNEDGQATSHTEEWNHQKETTSEDGFLGKLNEHRKVTTAKLTEMFYGEKK